MTVVTRSIVIDAPRQVIRPIYTSSDYTMQIYENVYLWEPDASWPETGAKAEIGFKATGQNVEGTCTSQEFDPETLHHVFEVQSAASGDEPSRWEWTFDEQDGKTTVNLRIEYTVPGRIIGPALDKLMIERQNAKLVEKALENMKDVAEGSAS